MSAVLGKLDTALYCKGTNHGDIPVGAGVTCTAVRPGAK